MKRLKYVALLCAAVLFSISCEKEIDVDLPDMEPVLVVEGTVSYMTFGINYKGQIVDSTYVYAEIKLTKSVSVNFHENGDPDAVRGAEVSIEVNGTVYPLIELVYNEFDFGSGIYSNVKWSEYGAPPVKVVKIPAEFGKEYKLRVVSENKEYTAVDVMPNPVKMDCVYVEYSTAMSSPSMWGYIDSMRLRYEDPEENNYFIFSGGYLLYHKLFNGDRTNTTRPLLSDDLGYNSKKKELPIGFCRANTTTVPTGGGSPWDYSNYGIYVHMVSKPILNYYTELFTMDNPLKEAPANPKTNLKGGAMGYFSTRVSNMVPVEHGEYAPSEQKWMP